MEKKCRAQVAHAGFTLIELAIVNVIIGLILGGVLVGKDLVKAGERQNVVRQIQSYNTAVVTFRIKYYALPGDINAAQADTHGLLSRSGADGAGDGDGRIENLGSASAPRGLGGETALFWRDLTSAALLPSNLEGATGAVVDSSAFVAPASEDLAPYLPHLRMRDTTFIHIYAGGMQHYYQLGSFVSGAASGAITWGPGITPQEAVAVDAKLDDARPLTGTVRAVSDIDVMDAGGPASATVCVDTDQTPSGYNTTSNEYLAAITCQLRIRAGF